MCIYLSERENCVRPVVGPGVIIGVNSSPTTTTASPKVTISATASGDENESWVGFVTGRGIREREVDEVAIGCRRGDATGDNCKAQMTVVAVVVAWWLKRKCAGRKVREGSNCHFWWSKISKSSDSETLNSDTLLLLLLIIILIIYRK